MAISLDTIDYLKTLLDNTSLSNKSIISIGDHSPAFTKISGRLIEKWGLPRDINRHQSNGRLFLKHIIQGLGYDSIQFLDNYNDDTLDYRINLSSPHATAVIGKKFGVV